MKQKQPIKTGENLKKILHNAKLKNTSPRLAVLEAMRDVKHPETAQEIHKRIKKIDLVTLYRTLATFEKDHIVKRMDLHKDAVYYELNTDHHHHIVCTGCGKLEDFELCDVDYLTKKIVAKASSFKSIQEHSLELFGICNACVKN
jgi:Fur family ferric uptake transcriptional regulator